MNIKERIGQRIRQERTGKGLTRKALAELTENLNVSRINNYERGDRTPGPIEIKELAKALDVSASFLMCLSDNREGKPNKTSGLGGLIPILNYQQSCDPTKAIQALKEEPYRDNLELVPISPAIMEHLGENAFALIIKDGSMAPEFRIGDVLIVDPDTKPCPGDFVVAQLNGDSEIIVRKYKQLSASVIKPEFELLALNEDWATARIEHDKQGHIIGVIIGINRFVRK